MRVATLISLLCLLLIGCGEPVTFSEPMPPGEKDLSKIPLRYRGNYVNEEGSVYIHINKDEIIKEYDYDVRIHRDSMVFCDSLSGDTIWDRCLTGFRTISIDSSGYVFYHVNEQAVVFSLGFGQVARKFRGRLFLNYPYRLGDWTVEQVQLEKGILSFGTISSQEEIEALNECVENDSDTIASPYSPTKREFRKFVKSEGFQEGEQFTKIK